MDVISKALRYGCYIMQSEAGSRSRPSPAKII